jgi:hypothetical protein
MLLTTMHCRMTTNTLLFVSPSSHLGQMFVNVDKLQEPTKLLLFTSSKESIHGTQHCPVLLSFSIIR